MYPFACFHLSGDRREKEIIIRTCMPGNHLYRGEGGLENYCIFIRMAWVVLSQGWAVWLFGGEAFFFDG
jgi:hypothetical protein